MLAIYQANPGAFDKNMNLLRSGAVLRIPENSDASAISPSEANGEIRRQYAAWRSTAPAGSPTAAESGRLRLVTPNESGSAVPVVLTPRQRPFRPSQRAGESAQRLQAPVGNAQCRARPTAVATRRWHEGSALGGADSTCSRRAAASRSGADPAPAEQQPPAAQAEAPAAAPPAAEERLRRPNDTYTSGLCRYDSHA